MADELEAGRELDALIARRVFGLEVTASHYTEGGTGRRSTVYSLGPSRLPAYSTEIGAAWPVFVWLVERYGWAEVYMQEDETGCEVRVSEYGYIKRHGGHENPDHVDRLLGGEEFAAAPLAICRAALMAMSKEGER